MVGFRTGQDNTDGDIIVAPMATGDKIPEYRSRTIRDVFDFGRNTVRILKHRTGVPYSRVGYPESCLQDSTWVENRPQKEPRF